MGAPRQPDGRIQALRLLTDALDAVAPARIVPTNDDACSVSGFSVSQSRFGRRQSVHPLRAQRRSASTGARRPRGRAASAAPPARPARACGRGGSDRRGSGRCRMTEISVVAVPMFLREHDGSLAELDRPASSAATPRTALLDHELRPLEYEHDRLRNLWLRHLHHRVEAVLEDGTQSLPAARRRYRRRRRIPRGRPTPTTQFRARTAWTPSAMPCLPGRHHRPGDNRLHVLELLANSSPTVPCPAMTSPSSNACT